jgi:hypothetical protein
LAIRFETSRILLSVQIGDHNEAGFSAGIRDEAKHLFIAGVVGTNPGSFIRLLISMS